MTPRRNRTIGAGRESLEVVLSFRSLGVAFVAMLAAVLALHFAALAHNPKEQLDPYRL